MRTTTALKTSRAVIDGEMRPAAVIVEDEVITAVVSPDEVPADAAVEELGDSVVMPGLVDPHVHVNEPGRTNWEGFETATKAACAGGITTIVDMPLNSSPVTTTPEAFEAKRRAAEGKLWVDCGFYAGLIPDNADDIEPLLEEGVLGVKAFLCHSGIDEFPGVDEQHLRAAMPTIEEADRPLLVHAELVDEQLDHEGRAGDYGAFAATRPQRFEHQAIELLVDCCRMTGCRVHVVHLAASDALPTLREARSEGLPVSVETCPHYLNFDLEQIPDGAPAYKCAPPIRDEDNRRRLSGALMDGDIDLVATDHSPSPPELKNLEDGNVRDAWGGIASLQLLLPAVWTAMRDQGATPVDIARWTSREPARLLGRGDRLGLIEEGRPANLVVWDPESSFEVDAEKLYHRHPVTPYDGRRLHGVVEATYLRGEKVFDGAAVGDRPSGQMIIDG